MGAAGSVKEALNWVRKEDFDIALLDMNISGQTAEPVAELLAKQTVPFGIVTAYPCHILSPVLRDRPCIKKPYHPREIRAIAAQLVEQMKEAPKKAT